MWIDGSGESQTLSEPHEGRPLFHPCHHKHIAVCQQETLAFIDLQPPVTPKVSGLGSPRPDTRCTACPLTLNGFRQTLNELNDMQNGCCGTDDGHETTLTLNSQTSSDDSEVECVDGVRTSLQQSEKPRAVTTICRPLHAALSIPLLVPLSSQNTNTDSRESQLPCSSPSPEGPGCQSPDGQPQRRTSQGSLKEKSIRECQQNKRGFEKLLTCFLLIQTVFLIPGRKMQIYSQESLSDESLSSPILDADYIFPGPFASFLEEDLCGLSSLEAISSASLTDGAPDLPNLSPEEPLQIIEDSEAGDGENSGSVEAIRGTVGGFLPRSRQGDQERRRFSASELISRLQLSQRKNSFTMKLGKSLSARVASRDRQGTSSLNPNPDCELTPEQASWCTLLKLSLKPNQCVTSDSDRYHRTSTHICWLQWLNHGRGLGPGEME